MTAINPTTAQILTGLLTNASDFGNVIKNVGEYPEGARLTDVIL